MKNRSFDGLPQQIHEGNNKHAACEISDEIYNLRTETIKYAGFAVGFILAMPAAHLLFSKQFKVILGFSICAIYCIIVSLVMFVRHIKFDNLDMALEIQHEKAITITTDP